jgi:hypothetical protein
LLIIEQQVAVRSIAMVQVQLPGITACVMQGRNAANLLTAALELKLEGQAAPVAAALPDMPRMLPNTPPQVLQAAVLQVSQAVAEWRPSTLSAAGKAQGIVWKTAETELTRQIRLQCAQRGRLLQKAQTQREVQRKATEAEVYELHAKLRDACKCITDVSAALVNAHHHADALQHQLAEKAQAAEDIQHLQKKLHEAEFRLRG